MSARWTSSAKTGVGTALTASSRIWFTVSHGILNEIYYPRIDTACTRDMGLIITDQTGYFSEEKRDAHHQVSMLEEGVPAFRLANTAADGRYRIEKRIVTDPRREALLQQISFEALEGSLSDYRLYVILAPHILNAGDSNTAWTGEYKGMPMLFASGRQGVSLALAASLPWLACSAGYVGVSDGWQLLLRNGALDERYRLAENGNVALCGEINLTMGGSAVLALGFGSRPEEAGHRALSSLQDGFEAACRLYIEGWRAWQKKLLPLDRPAGLSKLNSYRISTAVLATHQDTPFPGAAIASLSIPWGFNKGDEDLGGYHLVWPRDLVETAQARSLRRALSTRPKRLLAYVMSIQEAGMDIGRRTSGSMASLALGPASRWTNVPFRSLLLDLLRRGRSFECNRAGSFRPWRSRRAGGGPTSRCPVAR